MQKKSLLVALFCGALCLTGCLKNEESASVTQVRTAKANELNSIAELNKALAQVEVIKANAEATLKAAEAALKNAQAEMELANARYRDAETELLKVQKELQEVQVLLAKNNYEIAKIDLKIKEADLAAREAQLQAQLAQYALQEAQAQYQIGLIGKQLEQLEADLELQRVQNEIALLQWQQLYMAEQVNMEKAEANYYKNLMTEYVTAVNMIAAYTQDIAECEIKIQKLEYQIDSAVDTYLDNVETYNNKIAFYEALKAAVEEYQTLTPEEKEEMFAEALANLIDAHQGVVEATTANNAAETARNAIYAELNPGLATPMEFLGGFKPATSAYFAAAASTKVGKPVNFAVQVDPVTGDLVYDADITDAAVEPVVLFEVQEFNWADPTNVLIYADETGYTATSNRPTLWPAELNVEAFDQVYKAYIDSTKSVVEGNKAAINAAYDALKATKEATKPALEATIEKEKTFVESVKAEFAAAEKAVKEAAPALKTAKDNLAAVEAEETAKLAGKYAAIDEAQAAYDKTIAPEAAAAADTLVTYAAIAAAKQAPEDTVKYVSMYLTYPGESKPRHQYAYTFESILKTGIDWVWDPAKTLEENFTDAKYIYTIVISDLKILKINAEATKSAGAYQANYDAAKSDYETAKTAAATAEATYQQKLLDYQAARVEFAKAKSSDTKALEQKAYAELFGGNYISAPSYTYYDAYILIGTDWVGTGTSHVVNNADCYMDKAANTKTAMAAAEATMNAKKALLDAVNSDVKVCSDVLTMAENKFNGWVANFEAAKTTKIAAAESAHAAKVATWKAKKDDKDAKAKALQDAKDAANLSKDATWKAANTAKNTAQSAYNKAKTDLNNLIALYTRATAPVHSYYDSYTYDDLTLDPANFHGNGGFANDIDPDYVGSTAATLAGIDAGIAVDETNRANDLKAEDAKVKVVEDAMADIKADVDRLVAAQPAYDAMITAAYDAEDDAEDTWVELQKANSDLQAAQADYDALSGAVFTFAAALPAATPGAATPYAAEWSEATITPGAWGANVNVNDAIEFCEKWIEYYEEKIEKEGEELEIGAYANMADFGNAGRENQINQLEAKIAQDEALIDMWIQIAEHYAELLGIDAEFEVEVE